MGTHYQDIAEMYQRPDVTLPTDRHLVSFSVACLPVPQPRQRHRVVNGAKPYVLNYTDKKHPVQAFKAAVALAGKAAWRKPPMEGALEIRLRFVLPRPKALSRKKFPNRSWHCHKPDIDNLTKALTDCLNHVIYVDDSQICRLFAEKFVADCEEDPHVEVIVCAA